MKKLCLYCGKEFDGRASSKYCSKLCADKSRIGKYRTPITNRICEYCGNTFSVPITSDKRFCNTSCSAKWRIITYGAQQMSAEGKEKNRQSLKQKWQDENFRKQNYERMTTDNPVYMEGVVEKAKKTRLKHGSYTNNFKYGNGKISPQEQKAKDYLEKYDFYYNYAITTKLARDAFPEENFSVNYKPDFVNLKHFICIEIDGPNHAKKSYREKIDAKKERCLNFLGYKIYRFTNEQVDNGEFYKEVDKLCQDW